MSYVAVDALLDRLSEVIGQSKGTLRTVPALRFDGNLPPGLSNAAERRRSMETPRYFSSVTALDRSPSSSPVMGNLLLYKITVEVRVVRLVPRLNQLDEGVHRAGQSQAVIDGDVLRQAIEFPNNPRGPAVPTSPGRPRRARMGASSGGNAKVRREAGR